MSLTPQNIEPLSGLITSQLPSPNPEEANFETRVPMVESIGVKSKQFVFPHHSSQMIAQYTSGLFRSSPYIPTQIDNLTENANSNTITQSKH